MKLWTYDGRTTDGRTTYDGRTPEHGYTISSPCEPKGSSELKNKALHFECYTLLDMLFKSVLLRLALACFITGVRSSYYAFFLHVSKLPLKQKTFRFIVY